MLGLGERVLLHIFYLGDFTTRLQGEFFFCGEEELLSAAPFFTGHSSRKISIFTQATVAARPLTVGQSQFFTEVSVWSTEKQIHTNDKSF